MYEFKAHVGYIANLRPVWATKWDLVSINQEEERKEEVGREEIFLAQVLKQNFLHHQIVSHNFFTAKTVVSLILKASINFTYYSQTMKNKILGFQENEVPVGSKPIFLFVHDFMKFTFLTTDHSVAGAY